MTEIRVSKSITSQTAMRYPIVNIACMVLWMESAGTER